MKSKFIILSLILTFLLSGCSTPMKYQNSMFNNTFFENKVIYFSLNQQSDKVRIVKNGPNRGETKTPDNRVVFKRSIENLALETKLNLKYTENKLFAGENEIIVAVDITDLKWMFNFSSAKMVSSLKYDVKNGKNYTIIGIHKNNSGGTKEWNLYNSLKNANYLFLKELEKN